MATVKQVTIKNTRQLAELTKRQQRYRSAGDSCE